MSKSGIEKMANYIKMVLIHKGKTKNTNFIVFVAPLIATVEYSKLIIFTIKLC